MELSSAQRTVVCVACGKTYVFKVSIIRGDASHEEVKCPDCGGLIGEVRCDLGRPELIQRVDGVREVQPSIAASGRIETVPGPKLEKRKR